ncbi:hypothetical protein HPB51_006685 [Rhipicephalus microplus]|uniref:Lipocalin n=1 Tax=Rhipicephalus microplus TaxID=6941 RepID=A0A9J6E7Y6_RHIMP|nr:hypothetical protein HPB51_006685 [Rhipicephalus microplus]
MVEDHYLVYRNYLYDSQYGGTSRCVKFHKIVPYTDIHGLTKISWERHGFGRLYMHGHDTATSTPGYTARNLHTITSHHGYGCTLWRAASIISQNRTDYCDFIFDAVCGSSPKYYIYDPACEDVPETIVTKKAPCHAMDSLIDNAKNARVSIEIIAVIEKVLQGREAMVWDHHAIYVDCETCYIGRHRYARNGYGCTMWLPATHVTKGSTDYCDFIFDAFCGGAPKFYMYNPSCPALLEKAVSGGPGKV